MALDVVNLVKSAMVSKNGGVGGVIKRVAIDVVNN